MHHSDTNPPPIVNVARAIQLLGGPAAVARELHCSVQAVCFYRDGARPLPAEHAISLERLTRGAVTCEQLRPDVDWSVLRGTGPRGPSVASAESDSKA